MPRHLAKLPPGTRFRLAEMPEITGTLVKASEARVVVRLDRPEWEVEFVDQYGEPRQFRSRGSQLTSWAPTAVVESIGFETLNEENDMSKAKAKKAPKQPKSTKAGRDSAAAVLSATLNAPLAKAPKAKPRENETNGTDVPAPASDTAAKSVTAPTTLTAVDEAPLNETARKAAKPAKAAKPPKADGKLSAIDAAAKVLSEAKEPLTTKEMIEQMAAKGLWKSANGQTPAATLYSAILREIQKKGKESRFKKAERGKFGLNG